MMLRYWSGIFWLAGFFFISVPAVAQEYGPVFKNYGKVYKITSPDIPTSTDQEFKAVFDVYASPASGVGPNPQIETAARFLNMHIQAGIPEANLKVALVVHGDATEDLLGEDAYRLRHGTENKSAGLVRELIRAGVQIAVCGQSATSRNINREHLIPGVQWALSAMTALVHYQDNGYRYIKF